MAIDKLGTYYEDKDNWGSYSFTTVNKVIDNLYLEAESDSDSYIKNVPRHLLVRYAIQGYKELNLSTNTSVKAIELGIGEKLQMVLPHDFIDYTEVFVVGEDCKLYLLDFNKDLNISPSYLQDDKYELLFDDLGNLIEVDGNNIYRKPYKSFLVDGVYRDGCCCSGWSYSNHKRVNINTSQVSKFGEFAIDKKKGVIAFSSNLQGKDIVLRYVSDGMYQETVEDDLKLDKRLQETLESYVYHRAIERRRNVPANEKLRARNRYLKIRHDAVVLMADLTAQRINKIVNSLFRPNKF